MRERNSQEGQTLETQVPITFLKCRLNDDITCIPLQSMPANTESRDSRIKHEELQKTPGAVKRKVPKPNRRAQPSGDRYPEKQSGKIAPAVSASITTAISDPRPTEGQTL